MNEGRRKAIRDEGDEYALRILQIHRDIAFERGAVRSRMPSLVTDTAANPLFRGRNQVGDDPVNSTSYMGDVGSGARPSRFDPQPLGRVLASLRDKAGWKEGLSVAAMGVRWPQIVGINVARNCPIESFENGVLVLRASSTSWKTQMDALAGTLAKRVEESVGPGIVKDIRVLGPPQRSFKRGFYSVPGRGPRDTWG